MAYILEDEIKDLSRESKKGHDRGSDGASASQSPRGRRVAWRCTYRPLAVQEQIGQGQCLRHGFEHPRKRDGRQQRPFRAHRKCTKGGGRGASEYSTQDSPPSTQAVAGNPGLGC